MEWNGLPHKSVIQNPQTQCKIAIKLNGMSSMGFHELDGTLPCAQGKIAPDELNGAQWKVDTYVEDRHISRR